MTKQILRLLALLTLMSSVSAQDERESLADDLGLPDERAEYCAEEFEQAYASWGEET